MKAGQNKENLLPMPNKASEAIFFKSPETKISKILKFDEERTPDRPIHRRIPSLVSKDYRNGFKHKSRGKKSMEISQKFTETKSSPFKFTHEMKASVASTDIRGLSLFSSEIEGKRENSLQKSEVNDSVTEKLVCESYCYHCKKYVYTKVAFAKNPEYFLFRLDFICCVKELVGCCGNLEGQQIQHLCSRCNRLIWKIDLGKNEI